MTPDIAEVIGWCAMAFYAGVLSCNAMHKRRHREDLPQWKAIVGDALINQMRRVQLNHKLAGDDVCITCQQTYDGTFGRMVVTVERAEVDA
ncbi:hypothetical protein ABIC65_001064 [Sphingomonas trueperi]|uniref:hypothetical protein n=1 Tax=Sphingomonas trueperi TaxID=53317 RepID=UPI003399B9AC